MKKLVLFVFLFHFTFGLSFADDHASNSPAGGKMSDKMIMALQSPPVKRLKEWDIKTTVTLLMGVNQAFDLENRQTVLATAKIALEGNTENCLLKGRAVSWYPLNAPYFEKTTYSDFYFDFSKMYCGNNIYDIDGTSFFDGGVKIQSPGRVDYKNLYPGFDFDVVLKIQRKTIVNCPPGAEYEFNPYNESCEKHGN